MSIFEDLPEHMLEHVVSFLTWTEQCRLSGVCRRSRAFQAAWEQRQRSVTIPSRNFQDARLVGNVAFPLHVYRNLSVHLQRLDLTCHATDVFWNIVAQEQLFPCLKHVSMVGSSYLTDRGLEHLSRHVSSVASTNEKDNAATGGRGDGIESIDISFCRKTTYAGTFPLRDAFAHSLRLLRRQPEWLDGNFFTPFQEAEDDQADIHTYYADGTFSFNRPNQSNGFVMELQVWNDDATFLGDKLQYTNFVPPQHWPSWILHSYRPGVSLLKLPIDDDNETAVERTVLVGQQLGSMRPPRVFDLMQQYAASIPVGTSRYFTRQGDPVDEPPQRDAGTTTTTRHGMMISKMRVEPLSTLMPPDDLVRECRATCESIQAFGSHVVDENEMLLELSLR